MGLFGSAAHAFKPRALPAGLAAAAALRNRSPEADGYNTIYEKDGEYYTRAANPDYTYEVERPLTGFASAITRAVLGDKMTKTKEGEDPFIYTAIANPYAPAATEEEVVDAPVEFAEESLIPTPEGSVGTIMPVQPQPAVPVQQQPIVYDPYTMPRGLGDVQNPLFSGVRGNY